MCSMTGRGAKAEREEQKRSRWCVCGVTVVWCGGGERSKSGERGAKADGACVRGAKREEQKQMVRVCVEQAWCERGEQIREVLCIVCPDSFSLF